MFKIGGDNRTANHTGFGDMLNFHHGGIVAAFDMIGGFKRPAQSAGLAIGQEL
jgi:hypothetical protein